jgi:hypothetical protein
MLNCKVNMDSQDQYIIQNEGHGDSNQAHLVNAPKPLNYVWSSFDLRCGYGHVEPTKLLSWDS